jgi:hypothetical protein
LHNSKTSRECGGIQQRLEDDDVDWRSRAQNMYLVASMEDIVAVDMPDTPEEHRARAQRQCDGLPNTGPQHMSKDKMLQWVLRRRRRRSWKPSLTQ